MTEDFGWLGVGGGFDSVRYGDAGWERFSRFMDRAFVANQLLGQVADVEQWRARTGLRALYLVLEHSLDYDEPEINLAGKREDVVTYSVAFDWLSSEFADDEVGPWVIAGYLALALAAISEQSGVPLPMP